MATARTKDSPEAEVVDTPEVVEETVEAPKPERQSLRLQSKYRKYTFQVIPTRRVVHPQLGIVEAIPGVYAKFEGPQRMFDSQFVAKRDGWDEEMLDRVERKLVAAKEFMTDYYPAALSPLPEHLYEYARIVPKGAQKVCIAFWHADGALKQCPDFATAGRDYCHKHDPDVSRIIRGGGTTVG